MGIEEFYTDFIQEIYSAADADLDFKEEQFFNKTVNYMIDEGFVFEPNYLPYRKKSMGMKIDGYELTPDREILNLFICDFVDEEQMTSLTNTDIEASVKRVLKFFDKSVNQMLYKDLEESRPGYEISHFLYHNRNRFETIKIILQTNKFLSSKVKTLPDFSVDNYKLLFDIWDITRFHEIDTSKNKKETLVINFEKDFNYTIPSLPAHISSTNYQSYLCVINGEILSKLYEKFGARLLESNVRSFLQLRGNVNKGIRDTINEDPEMFFAYNNGLTATAEEIELSETNGIIMLKNFQIVNGGQTTASLFNTKIKDKIENLDNIFVQMKLTILKPEKANEVVPLISKYANTQNKVNEADFFSNDIFHIRIEEKSRRIWAPAKEGELKRTRWFYERARGQYQEAQSKMTDAKKEEFKKIHPKAQMFSKEDLAKYLMVWENKPHIVSWGRQKNFLEFGKIIVPKWNRNESEFNDLFFMHSIAKMIVFTTCDNIIYKESWYSGYKANIIAYTLSTISYLSEQKKLSVDFDKIWKNQSIDTVFEDEIKRIGKYINDYILKTPENFTNVSEWCKKELCWTKLKDKIDNFKEPMLSENFIEQLISNEDVKYEQKEAKENQKIENEMNLLKKLYALSQNDWSNIIAWGNSNNLLIDNEVQFLNLIPTGRYKSENQLKKIVSIITKLEDEGMSSVLR